MMVYGLDHDTSNTDKLFNLVCLYGNVARVSTIYFCLNGLLMYAISFKNTEFNANNKKNQILIINFVKLSNTENRVTTAYIFMSVNKFGY